MYTDGDTVYITCTNRVYDFETDAWSVTDCDSTYPKVTIVDPAGTVQKTSQSMTKKVTGKYEYAYTLSSPVAGWWTGYMVTVNNTYTDRKEFGFEVR